MLRKRRGVPYVPQGTFSGAALVRLAIRYCGLKLIILPPLMQQIYRENGLRGLYFGYSLHTLRDAVGTSLYFGMYDSLRFLFEQPQYSKLLPTSLVPFLCGSTCGILSWAVVYPLDAVFAILLVGRRDSS